MNVFKSRMFAYIGVASLKTETSHVVAFETRFNIIAAFRWVSEREAWQFSLFDGIPNYIHPNYKQANKEEKPPSLHHSYDRMSDWDLFFDYFPRSMEFPDVDIRAICMNI